MESFEQLVKEREDQVLIRLDEILKKQSGHGLSALIGEDTQLQRTDEWFQKKCGKVSGSGAKEFMTGSKRGEKDWTDDTFIYDFGETFKSYIFEKCLERKYGYVVQSPSTFEMRFGTANEQKAIELLKEKFPNLEFFEVDFLEIKGLEGIAGASPDGKLGNYGVEVKCPTNWKTFAARHEKPFDYSHQDFWQVQKEMMALDVDKLIYVTALPPKRMDVMNPVIEAIEYKIIDASPVHQSAIFKRCEVAGKIFKEYEKNGFDFEGAYRKIIFSI